MRARSGETRRQFGGARLRYAALFAALRSRSPTPRQRGHAQDHESSLSATRTHRASLDRPRTEPPFRRVNSPQIRRMSTTDEPPDTMLSGLFDASPDGIV